ncbi:MAG: GTP-binding protein EngA [Candidatus Magnetoglobus multicellularis str. Araruama]|uniref:GTP-binding protein EngA n=1 Tax=Candidatus Magnetoglobus multicellularis str. Araruama TaxID=890399 RepID=A0A1V1PAR9_9BACT|nr:MAG: GTP-binding protein EngA [Candidatus Magnetoglobus multicellularis str. Araruama]
MKCPACSTRLRVLKTEEMVVDVCKYGCGGIWLDRSEYKKVDQQNETAGQALLFIERNPDIKINHAVRRKCPRCETIVMARRFSSFKRQVEIDTCPYCGGYWLDGGELERIRSLFETEKDRYKATDSYLSDFTEKAIEKYAPEKKDLEQKIKRDESTISRFFRFLNPFK